MGLIDDIKSDVKKSGKSKGKIVYFKSGVKVRVRFLQELDEGMKVLFHDSFELGINVPCQELFDRDCEHHDDESLRHREIYVWSVWDYEAKEVKLLIGPANNYSPVPTLVAMYDTYETIMDRDYVITKNGSQTTQTWSVVPMDKVKFKNSAAKPYSESKTLSLLDKAFPCEGSEDEDEEPKKKKKKRLRDEDDDEPMPKKKRRPVEDDDDEDEEPPRRKKKPVDDEEDEDEDEEPPKKKKKKKAEDDYEDMTAKELYLLCKERGIKVKQQMDEDYYIEKLKEAEEDEEDEW